MTEVLFSKLIFEQLIKLPCVPFRLRDLIFHFITTLDYHLYNILKCVCVLMKQVSDYEHRDHHHRLHHQ